MLVVLIGTVILHLLDLILLLISTSVNAWRTFKTRSYDLWYDCRTKNGGYDCTGASDADWLQAVQALMILATIFCLLSLILFVWQLFTLNKGGRFFFTAVFQILSSLFVMSGAIIYTVMSPGGQDEDHSFGFAFVLAWLAFPLTLISGLIYIVLRKKE
ncbi:peripheral myelin protein 22a [Neoarius graeffei]|uniref:peripheral myelin protein 22a n=1 Tax=Neoarius graeffei TaxID=443677 RepID=UPI00298CDE93|nr:peripheral myelin protein 22a [Neoarius graeffei]